MNKTNRIRWALAAAVAAAFLATPIGAQDKKAPAAAPAAPAKADTKGQEETKVHVENDKVRVTDTIYKPGAASGMRERGARVTRAIAGGTMEKTYADGKKEVIEWKAGDVKFQPKETFVNKNVGKTTVHLYTVTLK